METLMLFMLLFILIVMVVNFFAVDAILARLKPSQEAPKPVTAAAMVQAHSERRKEVGKPPARWPAVKRQLEDIDAPEKRTAKVMQAHKDMV